MKKVMIVLVTLMFAAAGLAVAADLQGTVTDVKGKTVTIEITKGKAGDLSAGDAVDIKSGEKKAAPKKGGGMLQGC